MIKKIELNTVAKAFNRAYCESSIALKTSSSQIILSTGMPRSASTLLYNILRISLRESYKEHKKVCSCWIYDLEEYSKKSDIYLIKLHDLKWTLTKYRAAKIFYSYRDIRDSLVSVHKIFNIEPSLSLCQRFIDDYCEAKKRSAYFFRYEELTQQKEKTIITILRHLNVQLDVQSILQQLPTPSLDTANDHDKSSLMHGGHMTATKDNEWRSYLSESLKKSIKDEYSWWLTENNYPLN